MYIDESHASTQEDPIPDAKGMEDTNALRARLADAETAAKILLGEAD